MSEPKDEEELDDRGATPEVHDTPLGVDRDAGPEDGDLPGFPDPEKEEPVTGG